MLIRLNHHPLIDIGERSVKAPVVLNDLTLNFWAEFWLANHWLRARHLTFEAFLNHQVRNGGALFEKMRHHRSHRNGRNQLRMPRKGAE